MSSAALLSSAFYCGLDRQLDHLSCDRGAAGGWPDSWNLGFDPADPGVDRRADELGAAWDAGLHPMLEPAGLGLRSVSFARYAVASAVLRWLI